MTRPYTQACGLGSDLSAYQASAPRSRSRAAATRGIKGTEKPATIGAGAPPTTPASATGSAAGDARSRVGSGEGHTALPGGVPGAAPLLRRPRTQQPLRHPHRLKIAACAPASYGFVAEAFVPVTERVTQGFETDAAAVTGHVERLLDHHLRLATRAARRQPDVVVLPEDCLRLGALIARHGRKRACAALIAAAEARFLARVGAFCRRYRVYTVGGTMTCRGGRFYNTALMLDPTGSVIASYDKTHLPRNGEHRSLTPGQALPVFDTPIGRIGFLICWDILFPEAYATLALKGADLIIQPTFGHWEEWNDVMARARAMDWSVPLAVSMWGGCACIIDAAGTVLAHTGRHPDTIACATLDLRAPRRLVYLKDARRQKLAERRPDLYRQRP